MNKSNRLVKMTLYLPFPDCELTRYLDSLYPFIDLLAVAILGSTVLITVYGETMLLPATRDIIRDFDISYTTSSWILTAYLISGAVSVPIAGKLSDIYGRKKMVVVIMIIYIIGISLADYQLTYLFFLLQELSKGLIYLFFR